MMTYEQGVQLLGNGTVMKLEHYTWLVRVDDQTLAVRYHSTNVVVIRDDGTYQLNTGGWYSATTKKRFNDYSPVRVYSVRGTWYVTRFDGTPDVEFIDGMVVGGRQSVAG